MNRTTWSTCCRWLQRRAGARRAREAQRCGVRHCVGFEALECRQLLSAAELFSSAIAITLNSDQPQVGSLGQSPTYYSLVVSDSGRLTAAVAATDGTARLSLLSFNGEVLVQSDSSSPHHANGLIDLHLLGSTEGTTYYLRVEPLGDSFGSYVLNVDYATTTAPLAPMPVGIEPWSSVAADLNADGIVDLAVANWDSSDLSIYLGQGDGTFAPPTLFVIGSGANYIIACDFNGDGRLDLATANMNSSTVSILLGNGDGNFQKSQDYAAGETASGLTAGDFNRDGALDLAVAAFGDDSVNILLNDGTGVFAAPIEYAVGANPYLIASGDFNGDGLLDLAAPNYHSNDVSILLGNGDGTFASAPNLVAGIQPYAPIARDFNADGMLDLAVANYISNDVSIFLGNGDGTFAPQSLLAAGLGTTAIEAADFNGDGRLDLVAANLSDATLSLYLGRNDGTFESQRLLAAGTSPSSVTVADFNDDGSLDLGFTDLTSNDVRVLLGRGNASFLTEPAQSSASAIFQITTADFNGDGRLDLASVNYSASDVLVLLGNQDGTFHFGGRFAAGSDATAIAAGDVNSDGVPDLITSNYGTADISVLLGAGDGTFGAPEFFRAGTVPLSLVIADFNEDHILDVATVNNGAATVSILIGDGHGQFAAPVDYAVDAGASQLTTADFNQDGQLDLAVTNRDANSVSLLFNVGEGAFAPQLQLGTDQNPTGVTGGDFNGDGVVDLAVANAGSDSVSVFLGEGLGHFANPIAVPTGDQPASVLVGDFNHDQKLDLATVDRGTNTVTVQAGHGDGTFHTIGIIALGELAYQGVLGDFNGDGNWDFATANELSDVSVLLGQPDGMFQTPRQTAVAGGPAAIATTDFNSDGYLDFVTVNPTTRTLSVSLGRGDGTSVAPLVAVLGGEPVAVVTEDFNNDGRPDVAIANSLSNSVSILLGLGDGTFRSPATWSVGAHPVALVTGDFNHDGIVDLASSNFGSGTVSVLLGRADGAFQVAQQFPAGEGPIALTVSDLNHDGRSDLIVANSWSRDLTLLIGVGDGTFHSASTLALNATPGAVATVDFNGDGRLDITVTSPAHDTVSILFGRGDRTFQSPVEFAVGTAPESLTVGDFNRDGHIDIATANNNSNDVTVLLGQGDGTFPNQSHFDVGRYPAALITGDFNNDGRLDFATANGLTEPIAVALGLGNGSFSAPGASTPTIQSDPLVADWNADGVLDVVVLRNDGKLLYREGLAGGAFQAPVVINPAAADAVRDLTIVSLRGTPLLIGLNVQSNSVAVYENRDGRFLQLAEQIMVAGILSSQILAGDLNGDGLMDVVITSAASGKVFVYLQRPHDEVSGRPPNYQIDVGNGISDVTLVDVNGDGLPEIVVTDQVSGDIRVLLNSDTAPFDSQLRFRAGSGLTSVVEVEGSLQLQSRDASVAVVAGLFNNDEFPDLAVLNQGANRIEILLGDRVGGFSNPTPATSLLTGLDPVALVTADFNGDGLGDLAVLNQGSNDLSIFLNGGDNGFTEQMTTDSRGRTSRSNAGNSPTGMSVGDINGDGQLDLLLGNQQGDVLTLLGNGDGMFRPYQRIDRHVGLAITGQDRDQGPRFAVVDQSLDRVTFQSSEAGVTFQQGREDGLLAPSAVEFADLNSDGIDDLIVSNGGSNQVIVYLGLSDDQFDLQARFHFFVGTDPQGITISDLNGDGILDLVVANQGSNDVSLLFGQGLGAEWTLVTGPRLRAGNGPVATVVADMNADGLVDILVANRESNDVDLLVSLGQGFFNDKQPALVQTGVAPTQLFVGHFDHSRSLDVVTVNAGSHDLTVISGLGHAGLVGVRTVRLNASDPVGAIAQDFNHDGLSDLLVAHQSGQFTLWLGGSNQVQVINTQGSGRVTNISDLVLGQVTANSVAVYFTSAGSNAATLATFALNFNSAPPTSFDAFTSFNPLPVAMPTSFNSVPSTNTFFTITNELLDRGVSDRAGSLTLLPLTLFNSEISNSEFSGSGADVAVAEFSSASGSQLEIVATLVLGFRETSTEEIVQLETDTDEQALTDQYETATARDLLITGVMQTPAQQHLQVRTNQETAIEILFSSPLDLFDVSHPIPLQSTSGQTANGAHSTERAGAGRRFQMHSDRRQAPRRSQSNDSPPLLHQASAGPGPNHLCALAICFASVFPLSQEFLRRQLFGNQCQKGLAHQRKHQPS